MAFDPKHIVVPVAINEQDLSLAEYAVFAACDVAIKFSSKITLLHLVPPLKPGVAQAIDFSGQVYKSFVEVLESRLKEGRKRLKCLEESAEGRGVKVEIRVMESLDSISNVILEAAEDLEADLLVICSHGYHGFSRALFGSVAEKVVEHATVPVLILHQKKPGRRAP
ncbi:MAG TPA: universal stress protein [Myxococcota bacterium]|nr:universal stress protein [Myxococcota bacterium]